MNIIKREIGPAVAHVSYIPDVQISIHGGGKDYFVWGIFAVSLSTSGQILK
jgi:hypothetical protein